MITFLRKIRFHMLGQANSGTASKTFVESGVGSRYILYAIGEVLLVMVGILLALQVNNWNEDKKNRALEKVLLREIHEEFKWNLAEFEGNLNRYERVREGLIKIIDYFPIDPKEINLDTLANAFEQIHFQGNYDRSLTAISKLKSTSSFDIISDEELRTLLIEWEVKDSDYQYDENRALQFHQEQFAPLMYEKFSRPYIPGLKDSRVDLKFLQSLEFEGIIKLKLNEVNNLFRAMRGDPNMVTVMERIIELTEID